jgi:uncharacterized protein YecT (DUF1311 family)
MKFLLALGVAALPFTATAQTQAEMNEEAAADFKKADAALNAAYKELKAVQDEEGAIKLKTAQKAWLAYRDAEAAFEAAPNDGGSIYPLVLLEAKTRITEARTKELREVLAAAEEESDSDEEAETDEPRDANGNPYGHGYNPDGADDPNM